MHPCDPKTGLRPMHEASTATWHQACFQVGQQCNGLWLIRTGCQGHIQVADHSSWWLIVCKSQLQPATSISRAVASAPGTNLSISQSISCSGKHDCACYVLNCRPRSRWLHTPSPPLVIHKGGWYGLWYLTDIFCSFVAQSVCLPCVMFCFLHWDSRSD
jgi:hypothetical protein